MALLAIATVLLPAFSMVGHADYDSRSSRSQEVVVTGHDRPEPSPHIEALTGTLELHCFGCLLENRQPVEAVYARSLSRPRTVGSPGLAEVLTDRRPALPRDSSPRAPPSAYS